MHVRLVPLRDLGAGVAGGHDQVAELDDRDDEAAVRGDLHPLDHGILEVARDRGR